MKLGDAGFGRDQEAPPDQRTDIPKHYAKLIKSPFEQLTGHSPGTAQPHPPVSSALLGFSSPVVARCSSSLGSSGKLRRWSIWNSFLGGVPLGCA